MESLDYRTHYRQSILAGNKVINLNNIEFVLVLK